jgi:hypothetical protein
MVAFYKLYAWALQKPNGRPVLNSQLSMAVGDLD